MKKLQKLIVFLLSIVLTISTVACLDGYDTSLSSDSESIEDSLIEEESYESESSKVESSGESEPES